MSLKLRRVARTSTPISGASLQNLNQTKSNMRSPFIWGAPLSSFKKHSTECITWSSDEPISQGRRTEITHSKAPIEPTHAKLAYSIRYCWRISSLLRRTVHLCSTRRTSARTISSEFRHPQVCVYQVST